MNRNPMLSQLGQLRNSNNNSLLNLLQNSQNPRALIQSMIAKNPQVNQLIKQYGNGDPKAAFYEFARIKGQDPTQILNMLQRFFK